MNYTIPYTNTQLLNHFIKANGYKIILALYLYIGVIFLHTALNHQLLSHLTNSSHPFLKFQIRLKIILHLIIRKSYAVQQQ